MLVYFYGKVLYVNDIPTSIYQILFGCSVSTPFLFFFGQFLLDLF